MSEINIIEFYSRLGVNPYWYIAVLVVIVVVIFLIMTVIHAVLFKGAVAARMSSLDKTKSTVHARVMNIDISEGEWAKAVFEDEDGKEYRLIVSKRDTAFLTISEEGELSFQGDKFVSFKRSDEK